MRLGEGWQMWTSRYNATDLEWVDKMRELYKLDDTKYRSLRHLMWCPNTVSYRNPPQYDWERRSFGVNAWLGYNTWDSDGGGAKPYGLEKGTHKRVSKPSLVIFVAEGRNTNFRGPEVQTLVGTNSTGTGLFRYGHYKSTCINIGTFDGACRTLKPMHDFKKYYVIVSTSGEDATRMAPNW